MRNQGANNLLAVFGLDLLAAVLVELGGSVLVHLDDAVEGQCLLIVLISSTQGLVHHIDINGIRLHEFHLVHLVKETKSGLTCGVPCEHVVSALGIGEGGLNGLQHFGIRLRVTSANFLGEVFHKAHLSRCAERHHGSCGEKNHLFHFS